jgi:DNA-binding SARP family transcriptional activator
MAAPARIELSLLNGFAVRRVTAAHGSGGHQLSPSSAGRRVLAYLAIHGPSTRHEIAGRLWPDLPEYRARGRLRTAAWRLNRDADLIDTCGEVLALSPAVHLDLDDLHSRLIRALDTARDPAEDDLATGPLLDVDLLPGWHEEWVAGERGRLRQLRLRALERISGLLLTRGRYVAALAAAQEVTRADPQCESAHRVIIIAHLAEDQVTEALRHYQRFRALKPAAPRTAPSGPAAALLAGRLRLPVPRPTS